MIVVDWGTTSLRAYLLDDGAIVDRARSDGGVMNVPTDGHADALWAVVGTWLSVESLPVVVGGMGGSSLGIVETGYVDTPADMTALAAGAEVRTWRGGDLVVLPGVRSRRVGHPTDVMRGEELEVLGAHLAGGVAVVPGSHSKWVRCGDGVIDDLRTYLTGELLQALRTSTILARSVGDGVVDPASTAFVEAVDEARHGNLLHALFSVRTASLEGADAVASASRLAGLVVGDEVADGLAWAGAPDEVLLIANDVLRPWYEAALARHGVEVRSAGQDAAASGMWRVATARQR